MYRKNEGGQNSGAPVDIKTIETALEKISSDVKKAAEQAVKQHGELSESTKASIDKLLAEQADLKGRLAAAEQEIVAKVEKARAGEVAYKSVGRQVQDAEVVKALSGRMDQGKSLTVPIDVKTANVTSDLAARVIPVDRIAPVSRLRRQLFVRDLLSQGTTGSNALEYVRVTGFTNNAEAVTEGARKPQSTLSYDLQNTTVKTLAHVYKASKQILADLPQLASDIDNELRYGLKLVEETEILNGSGTGAHLHGIIPQATAYSGAFVPTNETDIDQIRLAILQAELALLPASAIVLNPTDWAKIELTKDSQNRYIFAAPYAVSVASTLWGLPVVATQGMTASKFLLGAFDSGATIYDREEMNVVIATQNEDDFVKNMITIRCEERLALVVKRPEAFIYGTFIA